MLPNQPGFHVFGWRRRLAADANDRPNRFAVDIHHLLGFVGLTGAGVLVGLCMLYRQTSVLLDASLDLSFR